MARTTMSDLIAYVRVLIDDEGGTPVFTDDEIQAKLDANRTKVVQAKLIPHPINTPSGQSCIDFTYPAKMWEGGNATTLYDKSYNVIAEMTYEEDAYEGWWVFSTNQINNMPLYITGWVYDVFKVAVQLLEAWAAKLKLEYSFTTSGVQAGTHSSNLSQKVKQVLALADDLRQYMKVKTVPSYRTDLEP
ncbi:MAG: hypothetical protein ABI670_19660 [Chloroflexota bacterium]